MSTSVIQLKVLFCFVKIVSSQYNSSTLTQLKKKKKGTKTRKTIILCIKHQYRTDKRFTLCVLVHVYKIYTTELLKADNYSPHPILGGWGLSREGFFPTSLSLQLPTPNPQHWKNHQEHYCLWQIK